MNFNKPLITPAKIWLLFACKPVIAQDSQIFDIYDCVARRFRGDIRRRRIYQLKTHCLRQFVGDLLVEDVNTTIG